MQLKIYRKSTLFLGLILLADLLGIVFLVTQRAKWEAHKIETFLIFILGVFVLYALYASYDLLTDRRLIKKTVSNGDVALAKIVSGSFVRFGRDARLKNHVYWKLDCVIYDNDMKEIPAEIVEKFSTHQTKIPNGFVFVTYVEGRPEDSLIIPNVIISSIPEYKPLVDDYEKSIRPKYLNAYIKDGLILETYRDTLKKR
ncbi:MAG: hypothetical protein IIZ47_00420 [Erysipelotrichaceae bacterium]|nr:hypothetical protein [Erysipelotrichaceae bacterium]